MSDAHNTRTNYFTYLAGAGECHPSPMEATGASVKMFMGANEMTQRQHRNTHREPKTHRPRQTDRNTHKQTHTHTQTLTSLLAALMMIELKWPDIEAVNEVKEFILESVNVWKIYKERMLSISSAGVTRPSMSTQGRSNGLLSTLET